MFPRGNVGGKKVNTKGAIFGKEKCKTHRRDNGDVTSVFLSLYLSLSLSLTERTSRFRASYIVREVLLMREREREIQKERERERERERRK